MRTCDKVGLIICLLALIAGALLGMYLGSQRAAADPATTKIDTPYMAVLQNGKVTEKCPTKTKAPNCSLQKWKTRSESTRKSGHSPSSTCKLHTYVLRKRYDGTRETISVRKANSC